MLLFFPKVLATVQNNIQNRGEKKSKNFNFLYLIAWKIYSATCLPSSKSVLLAIFQVRFFLFWYSRMVVGRIENQYLPENVPYCSTKSSEVKYPFPSQILNDYTKKWIAERNTKCHTCQQNKLSDVSPGTSKITLCFKFQNS